MFTAESLARREQETRSKLQRDALLGRVDIAEEHVKQSLSPSRSPNPSLPNHQSSKQGQQEKQKQKTPTTTATTTTTASSNFSSKDVDNLIAQMSMNQSASSASASSSSSNPPPVGALSGAKKVKTIEAGVNDNDDEFNL